MGHRFGHECQQMDQAIFHLDEKLAQYIHRWRADGYEVIVTADHGQNERGHHGGNSDIERDFALYYFGATKGVDQAQILDQRQLAPTILTLLGAEIPDTMQAETFLGHDTE
jgi:predicted AlkP superfamily pyrophosphatase or phosphodiesterase